HAAETERIPMMLIERDDVVAQFLGVAVLVDIIVVFVGGFFPIEELVGNPEVGAVLQDFLFREPSRGPLSEISQLHRLFSLGSFSPVLTRPGISGRRVRTRLNFQFQGDAPRRRSSPPARAAMPAYTRRCIRAESPDRACPRPAASAR